MKHNDILRFGPFCVDVDERLLWNGEQRVDLRGKAFDVLVTLLRCQGRTASKEELLQKVWRNAAVEDANLTVAMSQLRKVLREQCASMDYIETLPCRGYRLHPNGQSARPRPRPRSPSSTRLRATVERAVSEASSRAVFVGREAELDELNEACDQVREGAHRVIFLTGDPGIGKSALLDQFCDSVQRAGTHWLARGACLDGHGSREPYLPILAAFARLGKGAAQSAVQEVFERVAPTWSCLLPSLFPADRLEELARRGSATAPPRMLQEAASALELIAQQKPVLFCLEDLHWADASTLELLSYLARSAELTRVLLVASCRPAESSNLAFLMNDLSVRGLGRQMPIEPLEPTEVQRYLDTRFGADALPATLARLIHERTCGTPLFIVQWLDALQDQGLLQRTGEAWTLTASVADAARSVPSTTVQAIEMQFDRLEPLERSVLEAGCVAGAGFGAVAIADVLGQDSVEIERLCLKWASQKRFLRILGEASWPDGTRTTLFSFGHALYQEVLYRRIGAATRARFHGRFAARMESAFGQSASEIAGELAVHFERCGDHLAAARYLYSAGRTAMNRFAYSAAAEQLQSALSHSILLLDSPTKLCLELELQSALGAALSASASHMDARAQAAYGRVRKLSEQLGSTPLSALFGAWMALFMRGQYAAADELALQLAERAPHLPGWEVAAAVKVMVGLSAFYLGRLAEARRELEAGLGVLDSEGRSPAAPSEIDPVAIAYNLVWADWVAGFPDTALARIECGLASHQVQDQSPGKGYLLHFASIVHEERGEYELAVGRARAMLGWCDQLGFLALLARVQTTIPTVRGGTGRGLSRSLQGCVADLIGAGAGVAVTRPYALLAEVYLREGRLAEASQALRNAFEWLNSTQERWWEPELHRLQGQLFLARAPSDPGNAEACLQRSLEVAQAQGARSFELRAAMSLARLWDSEGRREPARKLLENTYAAFTEGFGTKDLRDARQLLETLTSRH